MTPVIATRIRWWFVLLAGLGILIFGVAPIALRVPALEPDYSGEPIPFDHLATEETDPFTIGSKRLRPTVESWRSAIVRYTDVRDCLIPEQRNSKTPDLRMIDWSQINRSWNAGSVCLWRIFSSLGSPERSAEWLAAQGFRVRGPSDPDWQGEIWLSGGYNPRDDGVLLPGGSWVRRLISKGLIYGEGVTASWDVHGRLMGTQISSSIL